jgi:predicted tellurium resistance membrane protein TerC
MRSSRLLLARRHRPGVYLKERLSPGLMRTDERGEADAATLQLQASSSLNTLPIVPVNIGGTDVLYSLDTLITAAGS